MSSFSSKGKIKISRFTVGVHVCFFTVFCTFYITVAKLGINKLRLLLLYSGMSRIWIRYIYLSYTLQKNRYFALHMSVCWSVGRSLSANLCNIHHLTPLTSNVVYSFTKICRWSILLCISVGKDQCAARGIRIPQTSLVYFSICRYNPIWFEGYEDIVGKIGHEYEKLQEAGYSRGQVSRCHVGILVCIISNNIKSYNVKVNPYQIYHTYSHMWITPVSTLKFSHVITREF